MGEVRADNKVELFLELLRAGLWEDSTGLSGDAFRRLSAEDWAAIYNTAREQTVCALVFKGVCDLPDDCLPPEGVLMRWAAEVEAIERNHARMLAAQESLLDFFRSEGLDPVVMKGLSAAGFYASPSLRELGDIDLYFPSGDSYPDSFEAAARFLRKHGIKYEYDSEGAVSYLWEGILVEQHPRFLDISNPFSHRQLKKLEAKHGFDSPIMILLLLNTHILKHALGKGIGFRQFCDMARAMYSLEGKYDKEEYYDACRSLGLSRWTRMLDSFLSNCLMMSEENPEKGDKLLDVILKSGNFGRLLHGVGNGEISEAERKVSTALAFVRNAGFGISVAPMEYFGLMAELALGQLKSDGKNI